VGPWRLRVTSQRRDQTRSSGTFLIYLESSIRSSSNDRLAAALLVTLFLRIPKMTGFYKDAFEAAWLITALHEVRANEGVLNSRLGPLLTFNLSA